MGTGTPIARVRGLGSAKNGAHHWGIQRLTAFGNMLLVPWFVASLALMPSLDHKAVLNWLSSPLAAVPLMLMVVSIFWHLRMGMQVLIEDYVSGGPKIAALLVLNFYVIGGAALALFSIARIAFTGVAA